jgi:gliding motility-associated-like protein
MKPNIPALIFLVITTSFNLFAQKDTAFWFVAPEVTQGTLDYDRPVVFRFSTYESPAVITVSQPANPAFPPQVLNLPANTSGNLVLGTLFNFVENRPPNQVLKKGFYISATNPISAYYEVLGGCLCNPEIFSLKGKNALGLTFFTPFQSILENSSVHSPLPHAAIDIVATEDNTSVTILPTRNLVGHVANIPFVVQLQRGETYCAEALGQTGNAHPTGTKITSNKPIAVTVKDDLVDGGGTWGGSCRDLMGDQIVPVEKVGTQYVIQKGALNGPEFSFVVATANNTEVKLNGVVVGIINEGNALTLNITGVHFISTSAPAYVLQMTGNGCELGAEVLPPLDCGGSRSIRFVRATEELFYLFLVTKNGFQSGFTINGSNAAIPASAFSIVPGSNGMYVAATINVSTIDVPALVSSVVENSLGLFQMGFINGKETATGARFGYFSDYSNAIVIEKEYPMCFGDTLHVHNLSIASPGYYASKVSSLTGCDSSYEIHVVSQIFVNSQATIQLCPNSFVTINGTNYNQPAVVLDSIPAQGLGCDTIVTYTIELVTQQIQEQTIDFCNGDTVVINGVAYTEPVVFNQILPGGNNCDTLLITTLQYADLPQVEKNIILCSGQKYFFEGQFYSPPEQIVDTIPNPNGCDTVLTLNLILDTSRSLVLPNDTILCPGDQIRLNSPYSPSIWNGDVEAASYTVTTPGIITIQVFNENNCIIRDTMVVNTCCSKENIFIPNVFSPNDDNINDEFCINAAGICQNFSYRIYSRWGESLFYTNNPTVCWDGRFRGKDLPTGVYIWVLTIYSDRLSVQEVLKGDVTIIR